MVEQKDKEAAQKVAADFEKQIERQINAPEEDPSSNQVAVVVSDVGLFVGNN